MTAEFKMVRAAVALRLGIEEDEIFSECAFADDLGATSLDIFAVLADLEAKTGLDLRTELAGGIYTVGDAVNCVVSARKSEGKRR